MPKTVMIGAGNSWGTRLSVDILGFETLREGEIALVDILPDRARNVAAYLQRAVDQHKCSVKVTGETDRRKVLLDADFVVLSFHIGGPAYEGKPYYYDIEIPSKYGVYQQVGDTIGPGGVVRFLRTIPVMAAMLRDIEELAPNARLINYVNPMSMLTWAANEASGLPFIGLCHSVQGGAWTSRTSSASRSTSSAIPAPASTTWVGSSSASAATRTSTRGSSRPPARTLSSFGRTAPGVS
jgi:alpha-galactosidase